MGRKGVYRLDQTRDTKSGRGGGGGSNASDPTVGADCTLQALDMCVDTFTSTVQRQWENTMQVRLKINVGMRYVYCPECPEPGVEQKSFYRPVEGI